jgi:hypothetical protein
MKTTMILGLVGVGLCLWAPLPAGAQTYEIPWFTIDGGGGTSTGGVYSVSGTIGQPDAAVMSGGQYAVVGGFWSAFANVVPVTGPELTIDISGKTITISWPSPSTGFTLQATSSLGPTSWQPITRNIISNSSTISYSVTEPAGTTYYRLSY